MAIETLLFVSKRLQAAVAALVCLAFVQLATAAGSSEGPPAGVVRVAISR
jgi:hypothetical protein